MIDIVALGMPCDKQTNFSYFFSALSTFYFGIRLVRFGFTCCCCPSETETEVENETKSETETVNESNKNLMKIHHKKSPSRLISHTH